MDKVNLAEKFALFSEHWNPKIVETVDDYDVKIVKVEGDFVWHKHDDADEMFLIIKGSLNMDFQDRRVVLQAGEMIVVPKGVEHKPHADSECEMLLLERKNMVNTGDAATNDLTATVERI